MDTNQNKNQNKKTEDKEVKKTVKEEVVVEVSKTEEEKMNEEIITLKAQVEEMKLKYLRALADYQNYEKRMIQDRARIMKMAHQEVLIQLLPVFDNIDTAEVFVKDPGLKMVVVQLHSTLESMGITELKVLDKEFDPYTAEAIELVPGKKANFVVEVISKGYGYEGEVIRPAKVKVGKQ